MMSRNHSQRNLESTLIQLFVLGDGALEDGEELKKASCVDRCSRFRSNIKKRTEHTVFASSCAVSRLARYVKRNSSLALATGSSPSGATNRHANSTGFGRLPLLSTVVKAVTIP